MQNLCDSCFFLLAAFMLLVLFRYVNQHVVQQLQDGEAQVGEKEQQKKQKKESMVVETEEKETQLALVIHNSDSKNKDN